MDDAWHIVGTGEADGRPALWLSERGHVRRLPLTGELHARIGGPRTCIGKWSDGRRLPCPDGAAVGSDAQCLSCSGLEHPECVFEPLCRADASACLCAATFRGVDHAVYCAFYGTLPKVGLTQERRLERRLREQGADLYFVVGRGLDRAGARDLEQAVSRLYGIPEPRRQHEVLPPLARPVPWEKAEARARDVQARLAERHPPEPTLPR
ncbi:MAG: DUF2797 domain-containing protein, partial [Halobacteriales archaeon]|nr:DUF2797 domain-containing protein [Halobacteriales archaeon]